jgi:hypothetical protein
MENALRYARIALKEPLGHQFVKFTNNHYVFARSPKGDVANLGQPKVALVIVRFARNYTLEGKVHLVNFKTNYVRPDCFAFGSQRH